MELLLNLDNKLKIRPYSKHNWIYLQILLLTTSVIFVYHSMLFIYPLSDFGGTYWTFFQYRLIMLSAAQFYLMALPIYSLIKCLKYRYQYLNISLLRMQHDYVHCGYHIRIAKDPRLFIYRRWSPLSANNIKTIAKSYSVLEELMELLKNVFEYHLIFLVFETIMAMLSILFETTVDWEKRDLYDMATSLLIVVKFMAICEVSYITIKEASDLNRICKAFKYEVPNFCTTKYNDELLNALKNLDKETRKVPSIDAGRIFVLNRELVLTIFNFILPFLHFSIDLCKRKLEHK